MLVISGLESRNDRGLRLNLMALDGGIVGFDGGIVGSGVVVADRNSHNICIGGAFIIRNGKRKIIATRIKIACVIGAVHTCRYLGAVVSPYIADNTAVTVAAAASMKGDDATLRNGLIRSCLGYGSLICDHIDIVEPYGSRGIIK